MRSTGNFNAQTHVSMDTLHLQVFAFICAHSFIEENDLLGVHFSPESEIRCWKRSEWERERKQRMSKKEKNEKKERWCWDTPFDSSCSFFGDCHFRPFHRCISNSAICFTEIRPTRCWSCNIPLSEWESRQVFIVISLWDRAFPAPSASLISALISQRLASVSPASKCTWPYVSHNHALSLEGDAAMNVASLKAKSEDSHLETFCKSAPLLMEATAVFI